MTLALLCLRPYRCRKCLNRFFRFRTRSATFVVPAVMVVVVLLLAMAGYAKIDALEASVSSEPANPPQMNLDSDRIIDSLALKPPEESLETRGTQSSSAPQPEPYATKRKERPADSSQR